MIDMEEYVKRASKEDARFRQTMRDSYWRGFSTMAGLMAVFLFIAVMVTR